MSKTSVKNLYDEDFYLWVEDTVSKLKARDKDNLDWENLIEEVKFLGKSQRKTVRGFLVRLLEHLNEVHHSPLLACGEGVGGGVLISHSTENRYIVIIIYKLFNLRPDSFMIIR